MSKLYTMDVYEYVSEMITMAELFVREHPNKDLYPFVKTVKEFGDFIIKMQKLGERP